MSFHPITLAASIVDGVMLLLLLGAAITALRFVLQIGTSSSAERPLDGERLAARMSLLMRGSGVLILVSTILFVVAVVAVLPEHIAGAMCGKGVVEATGNAGARTIAFQLVALIGVGAWHVVDRLNRTAPRASLTLGSARGILALLPFGVLLTWSKVSAWASLAGTKAVSCCDVLRESTAAVPTMVEGSSSGYFGAAGATAGALFLLSLLVLIVPRFGRRAAISGSIALFSLLLVPLGTLALTRSLLPYHFLDATEPCLYCLFLAEQGYRGYTILATLLLVAVFGIRLAFAAGIARRHADLERAATRSTIVSAVVLLASLPVLACYAAWPAFG